MMIVLCVMLSISWLVLNLQLPINDTDNVKFCQTIVSLPQLYDDSSQMWEEQSLIKYFLKTRDNRKCNFPLICHTMGRIIFHDSCDCSEHAALVFEGLPAPRPVRKPLFFLTLESDFTFFPQARGQKGKPQSGKDTVMTVSELSNDSCRVQA